MKRVVLFAVSDAILIQFAKTDVKALQTLGVEIHMICPLKQSVASEEARASFNQTYPKLIWHDLPFHDSLYAFRKNKQAYAALLQLLQNIMPDLIHCMGTTAGYYGGKAVKALRAKNQTPLYLYTPTDFQLYQKCGFFHRRFYTSAEKKYNKEKTAVLPVCKTDMAYWKQHFSQVNLIALPEQRLNYEYYAMPKHSAAEVRETLGIPEDAVVLLSIGTLLPQKRLRLILQALTRLSDKTNLHYLICGAGRDRDFLEKLTQRLHLEAQVHFLGYRTDVPDLLGAADIFCLPSRHETSCIAAQEAMAAGLPLIAINVHGMQQYAKEAESEIGAIFLKGDLVESCKDAILELVENKLLRKQMGAANRAIAKKFHETELYTKVRSLYQTFLESISEKN